MDALVRMTPRLKKEWPWLLVGVLAVFFLLWTRVNYNAVEYGVWQSDEFHTVTQGVHNLLLKSKRINFRAQEGVRWVVRGSYPYALYKLCQQMGSDPRRDNWGYPGHHWVQAAFGPIEPNNPNDPNVKLFLHALRVPSLLLFFASFLPLLLYCYRKKYLLMALGIVIAIGLNDDILAEQRFLYIEPTLIVAINLLIAFFLYQLETQGKKAWLVVPAAFLSAWAVSVKLTGLFFATLPFLGWLWTARGQWRRFIGIAVWYALLVAGFYLLINVTMFLSSVDDFIHDFFSNIWNYASAGRVERGLPHFRLVFPHLVSLMGLAAYLLPLIVAAGVWLGTRTERLILGTLAALTLVSVNALVDTTMYIPRNMISFYVPSLILLFLSLETIRRTLTARVALFRSPPWSAALFLLLLLFPTGSALLPAPGPVQRVAGLYRRPRTELMKSLEMIHRDKPEAVIYAIGFPDGAFSGRGFAAAVRPLPNAPGALNGSNFGDYVDSLRKEFGAHFTGYVAVRRIKNNFELTNCILPEIFQTNDEWGDYFIFHGVRPAPPAPAAT